MCTVSLIHLFVDAELQDWTPGSSPCLPTLYLGEVPASSLALTIGYHPGSSSSSVGQYHRPQNTHILTTKAQRTR